jgi:hypothetical protein
MAGIALVLHFGIFHLLSCAWRRAGVDARPLMDWPVASASVSEFWGRRWNTAFRDLTHRFLFRPLVPWLGAGRAAVAAFTLSGLVHELVISIPAGAGHGGPTLFFVIQGLATLVERSPTGRRLAPGGGWRGRVFTMLVILGPAAALFHRPFAVEIVVPFLRFVRAIP